MAARERDAAGTQRRAGGPPPEGGPRNEGGPDEGEGGRWLVVDGRRWRRQDPRLPPEVAERLLSHLGRGRSGVRSATNAGDDPAPSRRRVDLAKHGLGERGTPWWEQGDDERRDRWERALADLDQLDTARVEPAPDV